MKFKTTLAGNYKRLFFAFAVLAAITLASYMYVGTLVKRQADLLGRSEMRRCQDALRSMLHAHQAALAHAALSVKMAMDGGVSMDALQGLLKKWTELFRVQEDIKDCFVSVHCYLNGNYIDGTSCIPEELYLAGATPWLDGAIAKDGIFESRPYFDPVTQRTVGTVSMVIYDDDGGRYGVVALDYLLHSVISQVSSYKVAENGYALLADDSFNVLTFPDDEYVGKPMNMLPGYGNIVEKLEQSRRDILVAYIDSLGEKQIGFFGTLENGWRFGLVAPLRYYYSVVFHVIPAIVLLACSLVLVLCAGLVWLSETKRRSEEHGAGTIIQDARNEVSEKTKRAARLKASEVKISATGRHMPPVEGGSETEETWEERLPNIEELSILKEALAERDIGAIDAMLEKFARMRPEHALDDAITQISDYVLVSDFEEALDVVETLMKELKRGTVTSTLDERKK
ncbi:MAG: hypothetical protein LBU13_01665 [Synergistaceae bacterium]|jgi:hypothetical protein|nr:hypothetical protein [Synergistaceae bacterium]